MKTETAEANNDLLTDEERLSIRTGSKRRIEKLSKLADAVNAFAAEFKALAVESIQLENDRRGQEIRLKEARSELARTNKEAELKATRGEASQSLMNDRIALQRERDKMVAEFNATRYELEAMRKVAQKEIAEAKELRANAVAAAHKAEKVRA